MFLLRRWRREEKRREEEAKELRVNAMNARVGRRDKRREEKRDYYCSEYAVVATDSAVWVDNWSTVF